MSTVEPPQQSAMQSEFAQRVQTAYNQIRDFVAASRSERLKDRWAEWETRFNALALQGGKTPSVEISLVGGTGAGKSTLLNALIRARVLPVSNMRACTAAISEVAYADGPYRATVEFISRESWDQELDHLLADIEDTRFVNDATEASDPRLGIQRTAYDKLWTVYRPELDTRKEEMDFKILAEPPEIYEALNAGIVRIENSELKGFRREVNKYLDSKHRFWPLVKSVSIVGPFEALSDGAKLVDLPGVNDPNEAREAVTRTHLKTCRFVWIIFNIKRALTKDTIHLMQSDEFVRQIVMDGRADALTFVGTAADDVDLETGIEEFDLEDDAEIAEVIAARNAAVRQVIMAQLDELAGRLAQLANESKETAARLAKSLKSSQILTVSAREFLRLEGLARTNPAGLSSSEDTQIPALQAHMRKICGNYGVEAHVASLNRHLELLIAEIKRDIKSQRAVLKNQKDVTERQRKEMGAAVQSAQNFLERDLADSHERLEQDLEANQSILGERIKRAVDRARHDLEDTTLNRWARTHHGTIRAVCRRGGVYVGTTGRNDFAADLCKPILDGIAFAWSEFFGEKLRQTLEKWTEKLRRNAGDYRNKLFEMLHATGKLPKSVADSMNEIFDTTDQVLGEILKQIAEEMETRVTDKQRNLYEQIPEQVRANMQSVFEVAAQESGTGMKQRMIDALSEQARQIATDMFDDSRDKLLKDVRSLNNWLCAEYEKMIDAVKRNASLAAENLVSRQGHLTEDKIQRHHDLLDQFESLIAQFSSAAAAA